MRKTYIYDKEKGKMVEKPPDIYPSLHVMPDIQPYQVVGPEYGKVISSRSRHREYLKTHGLREVGDEKPKWMTKRQQSKH